jgi:RNA polymerase sigma factor (sigma-70 family)
MGEQIPSEYSDEIGDCFKVASGRIYKLVRALTRVGHAPAEDVTQRAFEEASKNWSTLRSLPADAREAWLIKAAYHIAIDSFRQENTAREKQPEIYLRYCPAEADVYRDVVSSMAIEHFTRVVDSMSFERARVAFLYWRCGWRQSEIAEMLGVSASRVSQQISKARATLRDELSSYVSFNREEGGPGDDR